MQNCVFIEGRKKGGYIYIYISSKKELMMMDEYCWKLLVLGLVFGGYCNINLSFFL